MERYFKPIEKAVNSGGNLLPGESATSESGKKPRVCPVLNLDDIVVDPGLREPIDQYDIGIRDQVRRKYLLMGPCQPASHNFHGEQHGNCSGSFNKAWFKKFDWLEYSVEKDAAYCFDCYLFEQPRANKFGSHAISVSGFSNWSNGLETFTRHIGGVSCSHNIARKRCEDFKTRRKIMTAGLECARFLLSQGLAFCVLDESPSSGNKGNFVEMLNWYMHDFKSFGPPIIENALGYDELTSPEMQKDLVKSCAEVTAQTIVGEIGDSYFSLLVDEPHDKLMLEKISVIVRFVNMHGQAIERLLGIEYTTLDTAPSMKEALYGLLARRGLSISRLRGIGCNLVSNMTVEFDELKSLILNENPYAHYVHCFANQFQSVIVSVARSIKAIGGFFYYVDRIVDTVGDSCRTKDAFLQEHYVKIVEKIKSGVTLPGKGKYQGTDLAAWPAHTQWGSYCKTLLHLVTTWDGVLKALETVCEEQSRLCQAGVASDLINNHGEYWPPSCLIETMETFEFVFILHLMVRVLSWIGDLSCLLKQEGKYIVDAMDLIEPVKDVLRDLQENQWDEFFEEVQCFCVAMSIPVPSMDDNMPVRGVSLHMKQSVNCYHYYHVEIFTALIDSITIDINSRFSKTSMEILRCIACLDPSDSFSKFDHGMLLRLAVTYSHDFSTTDHEILKEQLHMFILNVRSTSDFSSCRDLATLSVKMVQTEAHLIFPLVYRLIELLLILPVATATTERAFSARNLEFCNEISDEWSSDMMLCYVEREIFAGIGDENILQYFESMRSQRIHPSGSS